MPKVSNYPLLSTWAQESTNRLEFTTTEFEQGIAYKGSIVSNQLNGVSYILSQILQFNQCSGGLYQATMRYHKGNFVTILFKGTGIPLRTEVYRCINDNNGAGIVGFPPITGATITNENGIDIYTNGSVDTARWARVVNVGTELEAIEQQEVNCNGTYICELCTLPTTMSYRAGSGDPFTKKVSADLWITTHLNNKSCTVNVKLNGTYVANRANNAYMRPRDYFNMPVPNVSIGECIFIDNSTNVNNPSYYLSTQNAITNQAINVNNLYSGNITPYGFNVWVGQISGRWSLFLCFKEAHRITLTGTTNIEGVSIKNAVNQGSISIKNIIPVRPNGGASDNYEDIMSLREYDFPTNTQQTILLMYSKGEVELTTAQTKSLGTGVFWIMSRIQNTTSPSTKEHQGRHTRCYGGDTWKTDGSVYAGATPGVLLEPGLPNITVSGLGRLTQASRNGGPDGYAGWGYSGTFNLNALTPKDAKYADVTTKSISIARYLKVF